MFLQPHVSFKHRKRTYHGKPRVQEDHQMPVVTTLARPAVTPVNSKWRMPTTTLKKADIRRPMAWQPLSGWVSAAVVVCRGPGGEK